MEEKSNLSLSSTDSKHYESKLPFPPPGYPSDVDDNLPKTDDERDQELTNHFDKDQDSETTETEATTASEHPIETFQRAIGTCLQTIVCCCCHHVTVPDDYHVDAVEFGRFKKHLARGCTATTF